MTEISKLNKLEPYLPSSSEKKQAVTMYLVVGLILSMWKREVSPYTHHHIKQSLGWFTFLALVVFTDLILVVLWIILWFFKWIAVLITIPTLTVGAMWLYQARKWKYIRESEMVNRFFLMFSWMWNRVLNLFEANKYQIIDANHYRSEEQFYEKPTKWDNKENNSNNKSEQTDYVVQQVSNTIDLNSLSVNQPNSDISNWNSLDNNSQISINNWNIWIDLSGHEINNPENQMQN